MLNLQSKASLHRQAMQRGLQFLAGQPLTSAATVLMLSLLLILVAIFWNISSTIHQLTANWQHNGHILLYLKVPTDPSEAQKLLIKVQAIKEVQSAVLNTPEEGLNALQQQDGMRDLTRFLPDNPLPFVIDVIPAPSVATPEKLESLYQRLKTDPYIDEASLDLAWMKRLFSLLQFFSHVLSVLNALLALAVVLITGNTLKLIISDRTDEMMVFKLVGASDSYIMRPFLYSGMCYGLLAALLAWACTSGLLVLLNQKLSSVMGDYSLGYHLSVLTFSQTLFLLMGASLLGWLGARLSAHVVLSSTA